MSAVESQIPANWFALGDQDLQAAEILLAANGPPTIVSFHLQQSLEKYLKGYLIAQDWPLRRIHDLEVLILEAISRDSEFSPFLASCQRITEYYIESRYPIGVATPLNRQTLASDLATAQALAALVRQKVAL
jgi:HEPN domain-containing protein